MDKYDRQIINRLQDGLPLCYRPYAEVAEELGMGESELLARVQRLHDQGLIMRVGPMYHAERMGGALTLAAMAVPEDRWDEVVEWVNGFAEVAHNYRREHRLNMWFVLATEEPERVQEVLAAIRDHTGLPVFNMPKEEEYYVGLRFAV